MSLKHTAENCTRNRTEHACLAESLLHGDADVNLKLNGVSPNESNLDEGHYEDSKTLCSQRKECDINIECECKCHRGETMCVQDKTRDHDTGFCDCGSIYHHVDAKCSKDEACDLDPEFNDLDRGWAWVTLCANFFGFMTFGGSMYTSGIIHSALLDHFRSSVAVTAWGGALNTGILSLGGPLSIAVADTFSCRTAIVLSGLFYTCGYLGTAFAPSIHVAIFTVGIISGVGGALGYTANLVAVSLNFRRRRNMSLGIALAGVGIGILIFPPLMQMARDYYGYTGYFITMAAMHVNLITCGMLCFPSKLERHAKLLRKRRAKAKSGSGGPGCLRTLKSYSCVIFNKGILCLSASVFFYCLGTYLLYLHLPEYIMSRGFTAGQAAFFLSMNGVPNIAGRVLTGLVANADRVHPVVLFSGSMAVVAAISLVYPSISHLYGGNIAFFVIFGLFYGSCYVVTTSMTLQFIGIDFVAASIGLQFMCCGVGAIIGPVVAGLVLDHGGTYDHTIYLAGVCNMLGSVGGIVSMCFVSKRGVIEICDVIEVPLPDKDISVTKGLNECGFD